MDHPVLPAAGPAAVPDPAPSPAGRPRARAWAAEAGWHLLAAGLSVAVLAGGLRLDKADFHAPFSYEYDALLILPFVKSTVETGTHWHNPRLGAPGGQDLHDFPVVDHLHLGLIWLLGRAFPDPVVVFNLFHLLTYPLTVVTAMAVLRHFGLSVPAAGCGGLLYAFQPYHHLRGQVHYFLAAYYVVPLTLVVTLWVCRGRLPFFARGPGGRYHFRLRSADSLAAVAIGLATASAGAYYAFFGCALLAAAGFYGWALTRTWRAAASAWLAIGVVVAGGVANHAPVFPYQYANGHNSRPHARMAEDAERYGLKIAQLVLPVAQHNPVGWGKTVVFDPAAVRAMYQAPLFKELNETDWDPLGLAGAAGYLGLLAAAVLPGRRGWPVGPLAALAVFATLLGTVGGGGAVFNLLVSPQVRCYNRVSISIAFLAVFAVCWAVDRWAGRRWRWPAFAGLALFGVWDQTTDQWFPDLRVKAPGYLGADDLRARTADRFRDDRAFFARVEALFPDGGAVFTYPYLEYPESPPHEERGKTEPIESYDPVVGYLHTRHLRWSFGAMKGREWDAWMRDVCLPVASLNPNATQFLERLVLAGFDGLLADTRGVHPARWHALKAAVEAVIGHGALRDYHPGRRLYFYDLRGHRDFLERSYGPARFEAMCRAEREALVVLWLGGFASYQPVGYDDRVRWARPAAQAVVVNRSADTLTVDLRMRFRTAFKGAARLTVTSRLRTPDGAEWADDLAIGPDDRPPEYAVRVVVPPGRHPVRFRCAPETSVLPTDSRNELYTVLDFKKAVAGRAPPE